MWWPTTSGTIAVLVGGGAMADDAISSHGGGRAGAPSPSRSRSWSWPLDWGARRGTGGSTRGRRRRRRRRRGRRSRRLLPRRRVLRDCSSAESISLHAGRARRSGPANARSFQTVPVRALAESSVWVRPAGRERLAAGDCLLPSPRCSALHASLQDGTREQANRALKTANRSEALRAPPQRVAHLGPVDSRCATSHRCARAAPLECALRATEHNRRHGATATRVVAGGPLRGGRPALVGRMRGPRCVLDHGPSDQFCLTTHGTWGRATANAMWVYVPRKGKDKWSLASGLEPVTRQMCLTRVKASARRRLRRQVRPALGSGKGRPAVRGH